MKAIALLLALTCFNLTFSQKNSENFKTHQNLIGGVWKVDTAWKNGTPHKLFIAYESSLDGKILKTRTHGNISTDGYEFGLRNEGIRSIDKENGSMNFYEFDIFGGLTIGTITYQDKNIYYAYEYEINGEMVVLTDGWEYINENTYNYIVGIFNSSVNKWEKKFLDAKIKRTKNE